MTMHQEAKAFAHAVAYGASPAKALLTLVTREFQGKPMWAVDHPEHGELLMAQDVLAALDYAVKTTARPDGNSSSRLLEKAGVPRDGLILIARREIGGASGTPNRRYPSSGATFMTRLAVRSLLMASTKPKAQEFREWLADVSIKVEDTGGYLLNEAARETAFADTRTTVPLPAEIAGGYAALIEARKAEMAAREGELHALIAAATEQAERERLQAKLIEAEAKAAAEEARPAV